MLTLERGLVNILFFDQVEKTGRTARRGRFSAKSQSPCVRALSISALGFQMLIFFRAEMHMFSCEMSKNDFIFFLSYS